MLTSLAIGDTSWTLGVLIGLPIFVLVMIVLTIAAILIWKFGGYERGFAVAPVLVGALVLAFVAWGYYPYSAQYHQYREVGGTIATADSRTIGDGNGGMETKFVVTYEGSGQQYGCDDTRCATVRKGDNLHLACIRAWQFAGTDGYDCRFVSLAR